MTRIVFESPYGRVLVCDINGSPPVRADAYVCFDRFDDGCMDVDIQQHLESAADDDAYTERPAFASYVDHNSDRVDMPVEAYQWLVDFMCTRYGVQPLASVAKELRARARRQGRTTKQAAGANPDGQG